jgi:hypothetical protein
MIYYYFIQIIYIIIYITLTSNNDLFTISQITGILTASLQVW